MYQPKRMGKIFSGLGGNRWVGPCAVFGLLLAAAPALGQTQNDGSIQRLEAEAQPPATARESARAHEQIPELRQAKYELGKKYLAIRGYDPVAYFPAFGGKATPGDKDITYTHLGVLYRFATQAHREAFKADPAKYEPAYGGWCAYAMAKDDYTKANPKRFLIQGGRLMLFYDGLFGDTYQDWHKEGPALLEPKADVFWASELAKQAAKS